MKKRTIFFTMVRSSSGWVRVGPAYPSREAAREWLPFVRGSWRGCAAKIAQCTIRLDGGKVCEKSRRVLNEKFNMDS